jgi:ankyrin repeat protein
LDNEIKAVGKLEVEPDEFDDTGEIAYRIAEKLLTIFPDFAWRQGRDTDRTVFHAAADTGACGIIELATRVIVNSGESALSVIRQEEKNAQTALELAVEQKRTPVVELLSLDKDQLRHPTAERIITTAIDRGPIDIVKALLSDRPDLVTHNMFRKAIASCSIEILRFLIGMRLDLSPLCCYERPNRYCGRVNPTVPTARREV